MLGPEDIRIVLLRRLVLSVFENGASSRYVPVILLRAAALVFILRQMKIKEKKWFRYSDLLARMMGKIIIMNDVRLQRQTVKCCSCSYQHAIILLLDAVFVTSIIIKIPFFSFW